MSSNNRDDGYREAVKDDVSLATFMRQMKKFDRLFCEGMLAGDDLNIRLEVRLNAGELVHARVTTDDTKRPDGVDKRVEDKRREPRRAAVQ